MSAIRLYGYAHLVGKTIAAFVAGLDCGDYTVQSGGYIDVPLQSDPDAQLTVPYLLAVSGFANWGETTAYIQITDNSGSTVTLSVPVVVGFTYVSRGQRLRPEAQAVIKSPKGPGLGKRRRTFMYSALVTNSNGVSFGATFTQMYPAQFRLPDETVYPAAWGFSGVHWDTLLDDYTFDSAIAWQVARPYPLSVQAVGAFLDVEDR